MVILVVIAIAGWEGYLRHTGARLGYDDDKELWAMLLGGLWHGANWTFVVWGGLHGLYLWVEKFFRDRKDAAALMPAPSLVLPSYSQASGPINPQASGPFTPGTNGLLTPRASGTFPPGTTGDLVEEPVPHHVKPLLARTGVFNTSWKGLPYALFIFFLVNITWVFFRAGTFTQAGHLLTSMFGFSHGARPLLQTLAMVKIGVVVLFLLITQWLLRNTKLTDVAYRLPWWLTGLIWSSMVILLILSQESSGSFIYFQF